MPPGVQPLTLFRALAVQVRVPAAHLRHERVGHIVQVERTALLGEQARGLLTLAEIRIAALKVAFRNPVKGHEQPFGAPVGLPVLHDTGA